MRFSPKNCLLFFLIALLLWILRYQSPKKSRSDSNLSRYDDPQLDGPIQIASVFCGTKPSLFKKLKALIASSILMSQSDLNIHLVVDNQKTTDRLTTYYSKLPDGIKNRVKFVFHEAWYPPGNENWWKVIYKPCSSEKVFLQNVLKDVDRVLFLDADTVIVGKLEKIWTEFSKFTPQQVMAAGIDCPFEGCAYWGKSQGIKLRIPTVWESGLNSGVLFMRLDLLRKSNFIERLVQLAKEYESVLKFPEQDLLNILFSHEKNQHRLRRIDCSLIYAARFFCGIDEMCDKSDGLKILHCAGESVSENTIYRKITELLVQVDFNQGQDEIIRYVKNEIEKFKFQDDCYKIKKYLFWNK